MIPGTLPIRVYSEDIYFSGSVYAASAQCHLRLSSSLFEEPSEE
jgi:hypothetical protein